MKTKFYLLLLFMAIQYRAVHSQVFMCPPDYQFNCEYVANGNFEDITQLPVNEGAINLLCNGSWGSPTQGSPDLFSGPNVMWPWGTPQNIVGTKTTRSGGTYTGIYVQAGPPGSGAPNNLREYLQTDLLSPIVAGASYYGEFYVSPALANINNIDRIGMLFRDHVTEPGNGPLAGAGFIPQIESPGGTFISDCANWTRISGCFDATADATSLLIGNFHDDANTNTTPNVGCAQFIGNRYQDAMSYYYVEDVSVIQLPFLQSNNITLTCDQHITQMGLEIPCGGAHPLYNDIQYEWSPATGLDNPSSPNPTVTWGAGVGPRNYQLTMIIGNCTRILNVTVDFVPNAPVHINTNSLSMPCVGGLQLTAAPVGTGLTYLWNTGQTTRSITVNTPGTYTVVVTINGCEYVGQITIGPPVPPPITLTPTSETICPGQSVTLTADCPTCNSFSWNPNLGTGFSYVVSPAVTTTYVVTGTDSKGCTGTAQSTITVLQQPEAPIIDGIAYVCDGPPLPDWIYTILNYNPSYTYHWRFESPTHVLLAAYSPGSASEMINWYSANGSQLIGGFVIVTVDNGCSTNSSTLPVQECCSWGGTTWWQSNISDRFPGIGILDNASFGTATQQGILTIDEDVIFQNLTDLRMGPGSKILVKSGITLSLNGTTLQAGCNKMWKGIELENGARLVCENSLIRDAEHAIKAHSGSEVQVLGNSYFTNNFNGVYFPPTNTGTPPVTHSFQEANFIGGNLIACYLGQLDCGPNTFSGMNLNNEPIVHVANAVSPSPNLVFDGLSVGIIANNTDLEVNNSQFKNITGFSIYNGGRPWNGSGIYMTGGGQLTQQGQGMGITDPKSFDNCKFGIYSNGCSVESRYNYMNYVNTGYFITNTYSTNDCQIDNNRIYANAYGVSFKSNFSDAHLTVELNEIFMGYAPPPPLGWGGAGIQSQTPTSYPTNVDINFNHIHLKDIIGYGITIERSELNSMISNHIYLNRSNNNSGINLFNTRYTTVQCNYIEGETQLNTPLKISAINLSSSTFSYIRCNTFDKLPTGVIANGNCNMPQSFSGNSFLNLKRGLWLKSLGATPGDIGWQTNQGNGWYNNPYPSHGIFADVVSATVFEVPSNCPMPSGPYCTNLSSTFLMINNQISAPWSCATTICEFALPLESTTFNEELSHEKELISKEKLAKNSNQQSEIDLDENLKDEMIRVYPNPAKDIVVFENLQAAGGELKVFDSYGRIVIRKEFREGEYKYSIDISDQSSSVLFYKFSTRTNEFTGKIFLVK